MKIYSYYLLEKNKQSCLYAYTDDKKMANLFEKQRNMKKFKKKVKDLNAEELYHELNFSKNSAHYLTEKYLVSVDIEDEFYICSDGGSGPYALTKYEGFIIEDGATDDVLNHLAKFTNDYIEAMHDDIHNALNFIYYDYIHNSYNEESCFGDISGFDYRYGGGMEPNDVIINQLNLFVRRFGNTLK